MLLKKKIAFYVCDNNEKGTYPLRRARTIAHSLANSMDIIFLGPQKYSEALHDFQFVQVENTNNLLTALKKHKPHLLIRDSGTTSKEDVRKITALVPSLIHFDDFGEGGEYAHFVIQTLYTEKFESPSDHYVKGADTFIADEELIPYKKIGLTKKKLGHTPHLIVTFGEKDPSNLTFRALRHLLHLQIPLKVTIAIGRDYPHDISELRMMALSRRNTTILQNPKNLTALLSTADIVLCSASYLPYEISVMGIPCIVLSQNEFDSSLDFASGENGFTHLGIGRKVKQSHLLNAIMELILHDDLRTEMIDKQLRLKMGEGIHSVKEAILYCLAYPKNKYINDDTTKRTSDML